MLAVEFGIVLILRHKMFTFKLYEDTLFCTEKDDNKDKFTAEISVIVLSKINNFVRL